MAAVKTQGGEAVEAEALLRKALQIYDTLGASDENRRPCLVALAEALVAQGQLEAAELLYHQVGGSDNNITSFYGSSCANNGKDALNTPEWGGVTIRCGVNRHLYALSPLTAIWGVTKGAGGGREAAGPAPPGCRCGPPWARGPAHSAGQLRGRGEAAAARGEDLGAPPGG
eukprot:1182990-Prorocentrum_minimum.AAC.1